MYICTTNWGGPCPPQFILGRHTIYILLWLKWDKLSHFTFFDRGPPRTSSPPGAHVMGESSQLSMAYRYLSPKIKE